MELQPDQIVKIRDIISKEFEMSPYRRAATKIIQAGLTSEHLHAFSKTTTGYQMRSNEIWNTFNEMRDIELSSK